jgi:hypothetical protein
MRRSWAVLVTTAGILPLAAAGARSIASAAASNQPNVATADAFTVLAHATNFKMINVDGKGIGAGDYVVERWVLRHAGAGWAPERPVHQQLQPGALLSDRAVRVRVHVQRQGRDHRGWLGAVRSGA